MPIYSFKCYSKTCGAISEYLMPMGAWNLECGECAACGFLAERQIDLCAMRPDPYWSGVMTENYGYVTSSSKMAQIRKNRHLIEIGDRADQEAAHKTATDARKSKQEKFAKETRTFIETEFAGKGMLDSFGEVTPEAARKLSDEPITYLEKDDPRLK